MRACVCVQAVYLIERSLLSMLAALFVNSRLLLIVSFALSFLLFLLVQLLAEPFRSPAERRFSAASLVWVISVTVMLMLPSFSIPFGAGARAASACAMMLPLATFVG